MIALEVHVEELFLAEGFVAVAAGVRLLPSVGALMHDHMPLLKQTTGKGSQSSHRAVAPAVHGSNSILLRMIKVSVLGHKLFSLSLSRESCTPLLGSFIKLPVSIVPQGHNLSLA